MSELFVALTPSNLLACLAGTVLGTVVGVLPGLGPAGAMALVLPVIVTLGPTAGLIMLAGIYYGSMYGGSTTSILVNVPGEAASVVTTIDGYRLARRGRAGAALAVAALASFVAGTFSVVALQFAAPLVARTALAFGPAEYFAFALLGLVLLANLTGGSRPKSLAMVALGIMLSTVGMDPLGGTVRFTFGLAGSEAGLSFIAVTAGLFGVAEVLATMAAPAAVTPVAHVRFRELYPSREELRRAAPPMLRGTVLGFLVGLVPGPAATIASFVSYGVEKKVSRHREELGRGAIEGVAGPEAANNAAAGGGMIPLLSLGLPFTPATAVLLSGMLLTGVTPGPFLLRDHPQVFWGVIGSFYVGNVMLLLLNLPLVGLFARVATIPPRWLMPVVLVLCAVAAYADNNNPFDVWVLAGAGLLGYAMRRLGYDPAPLVLGLVLGPLLERSLLQALTIGRGQVSELWASPQAAVMLAAAAAALLAPAVVALARRADVRSAALALVPLFGAAPSVAGATTALDGAWIVAQTTMNGTPRGGKLHNATWTFRGTELVVDYASGERLRASLAFDETTAPPAVRVTPLDAPGERPVWTITARQGDELRVAFYDGVERRPVDFAARPKLVVLTLVPSTTTRPSGDPCDILRAAGVDDVLGGLTRSRPESRRGSGAGPSCAFDRLDGSATVSLSLTAPPGGAASVEAARREPQANHRLQIEEEPALGAGAFSATRGWTLVVVALKQGTAMVLRFEAPGVEHAELRRFAERVFDRL